MVYRVNSFSQNMHMIPQLPMPNLTLYDLTKIIGVNLVTKTISQNREQRTTT